MSPRADTAAQNPVRACVLTLLIASACARALVTHDPFPGWGLDPLTTSAPTNGIGPALSIFLDTVTLLASALALAIDSRPRRAILTLSILFFIGAAPAIWHAVAPGDSSVESARLGFSWIAAISAALAAWSLAKHTPSCRLILAVAWGLIAPLALRALVQVFSEHPVLVADFRARESEILASHGWAPGSPAALMFERRLLQPEPTGWFGMANVFASVAAASAVLWIAALLHALRARLWQSSGRAGAWAACGAALGTAASLTSLLIALPLGGNVSKGALAACAMGLALLLVPRFKPARARGMHLTLGVLVLVAPIAAVCLRGLLAERLGELSLLFRWFYLQGASRIVADHPLLGVGPDSFQAAYLLARPALSPEEVSSPHCTPAEWLATLGVASLAWITLLAALAVSLTRNLLSRLPTDANNLPVRAHALTVLAPIALALAFGFVREDLPMARATPEAFGLLMLDALVRLGAGGLAWWGLSLAADRLPGPWLGAASAAGALALLAHSQIELTGTFPASACWIAIVAGAAAAPTTPAEPTSPARARRIAPAAIVGPLALVAFVLAVAPMARWDRSLRGAAAPLAEVAVLEQRFRTMLNASGPTNDSPADLASDLSDRLGTGVQATPQTIAAAIDALRRRRAQAAADALASITHIWPRHHRVRGERIRLLAWLAEVRIIDGTDPLSAYAPAIEAAREAVAAEPGHIAFHNDLANVLLAAARDRAGGARHTPPEALEAMEAAVALDPQDCQTPARLALIHHAEGRAADAARWAGIALRNHENKRLDPLAGLSDTQVHRLREVLANP